MGLEDDLVPVPTDAHLLAFEAELLGQTDSLAAAMHESFAVAGMVSSHGGHQWCMP